MNDQVRYQSDASTPPKRRFPHAFSSLESLPFRWLLISHLTYFLAMQGQFLVRSLLAWELTNSELSLAYVNLVIAIPMVAGSFISGAIIDRMERKKLVLIAQLMIMVNELLVLGLYLAGVLTFPHLLITSFIMGFIFPFVMPTRTAMIYRMVGREHLPNAMALQAGAMNLARVLGPALTGLLIPLLTLAGAYTAAISLYIISTFTMLLVPKSLPDQKSGKSLLADIGYSFTYVARNRDIFLCLLFGLFPMLIALPVFSLMVVFADQVWQVGETGLGFLMGTLGAGGFIGALGVARIGENIKRARFMIFSGLLFAILLAGFSISPSFLLALFLLLVANIFSNASQTLNHTIIQLLAHDEVRGRMSSLVMISMGLTPLGVLPIAFFAERFGISITVFSACILLGLIIIGFYVLSPSMRRLDTRMAENARREALGGQAEQ